MWLTYSKLVDNIPYIEWGCLVCTVSQQQFKLMSKYNNHSESQQSDVEDEDLHYKATTGYGHIAKLTRNPQRYESSSESEESDVSGEENGREDSEVPSPNKEGQGGARHNVQVESSEEESENSIDHIEERIKRLQKDLEKKLDRHKEGYLQEKDKAKENTQDKLNHFKNSGSPPLPKKLEAKVIPVKTHHNTTEHKITRNSKESSHVEAEQEEPPLPPAKKETRQNLQQIIEEPKQGKQASPNKKKKEKKQPQSNNPSFLIEKKRGESKGNGNGKSEHSQVQATYMKKLNKANSQIEELTKALEESRKENKRLKEKLAQSAAKKKRSLQHIQKLKEITSETGQVKLEKQIQLLKIIEGLQTKLKKSINKKLGKSRAGTTSAVLLHKGLPSSLLP